VAAVIGAVVLGAPSQAKALYRVTVTSGALTGTSNDNNVPAGTILDTNNAVNSIDFGGGGAPLVFDGYTISFTGNTNTPGVGGLALQTSQTITITNSGGGATPLQFDVFADGYLPGATNPSVLNVNNSISTSLLQGGTASATTLANGGGAGLTTTTVAVNGPTFAASASSPTLVTPLTATPFSLTSRLVISGLGAGLQANITWTSSATATPAATVPAPGALVLLASGIPALGGVALRLRKKSV